MKKLIFIFFLSMITGCKKELPTIEPLTSTYQYTVQLSGYHTQKITLGNTGPSHIFRSNLDDGPQFSPSTTNMYLYDISPRVDSQYMMLFLNTADKQLSKKEYSYTSDINLNKYNFLMSTWSDLANDAGYPPTTLFGFSQLKGDYTKVVITNIHEEKGSNATYNYYDGTIEAQFSRVEAKFEIEKTTALVTGHFDNLRIQPESEALFIKP